MFRIAWMPKALRQTRRVGDRRARSRILEAVEALSRFPATPGLKRLVGHRYQYRLRVGHYRVLFDVRETIRIIEIQEVRKRDESTY